MRKLETLELRIFSKEKWEAIERAVEEGDELALIRLVEPEIPLTNDEKLEQTKMAIGMNARHEEYVDPNFFIYHGLNYEGSIDVIMDALTKFCAKHNISKNTLRYAVEHIDDDYTLKYQSQYNSSVREFLSEDDLNAMITAEDRSVYYQEQERLEEEREKEEKEKESHLPEFLLL